MGVAHASPSHPNSQKHAPWMHWPWPLQSYAHVGLSQPAPIHPPSHAHLPVLGLHMPYFTASIVGKQDTHMRYDANRRKMST